MTTYPYWEFWLLYHKCVFDGINKLIIITPSANAISVKEDIYSAWKEWSLVEDNGKFLPAIRTTGGDPIGAGSYTGDVYFLINGWRILVNHSCEIDGVIYSDDFPTPLLAADTAQIVTNKVSSLVSVVTDSGGSTTAPTAVEIRQEIDTNSTKLTTIAAGVASNNTNIAAVQTSVDNLPVPPTVSQISNEVRNELTAELNHLMTLQNGQGLDSVQATMLLEIYRLYGLDPTKPLIVNLTTNRRTAGAEIEQSISTVDNTTTVQRV